MNKRELLKRGKGLLAFVLAFMIMFAMPMQVLAVEYNLGADDSGTTVLVGSLLTSNDTIRISSYKSGGYQIFLNDRKVFSVDQEISSPAIYSVPGDVTVGSIEGNDVTTRILRLYTDDYVPGANTGGRSVEENGSGDIHEHNFNWKLTVEPTETTDGRYDYLCECGYAEGSQPVSFLKVIVDNIIKSIESAPAEGTVVIENKFLRCLTDEMMDALIKRPDVSLEVRFTDQEVPYKFVIPAGQYPEEKSEWYGYYYLGSIYGWKE